MNELGARLQALRRQANLSQQELAERLHVSRQSISKWELGTAKPDLDNMIRLSELFGVSLDELVLGKTQNRQEIPQYSAQPVENAKAKPKETNALVSACRCAVSCAGSCAFAPLHQMFDQHLWGNWYTSVWRYLPTVPHNVLLLTGAGFLAAAYWNKY